MKFSNPADAPNFEKPPRVFKLKSNVQGEVKASVVPSKNGNHDFLFCEDKDGRSWVGGVFAKDQELTSFGTNKTFLEAGQLTDPALDYVDANRNYDYRGEHVTGRYFDYSEFTHALPAVAEFRRRFS